MKDKIKSILALTLTAFMCGLLIYLVGGNIWKNYLIVL